MEDIKLHDCIQLMTLVHLDYHMSIETCVCAFLHTESEESLSFCLPEASTFSDRNSLPEPRVSTSSKGSVSNKQAAQSKSDGSDEARKSSTGQSNVEGQYYRLMIDCYTCLTAFLSQVEMTRT